MMSICELVFTNRVCQQDQHFRELLRNIFNIVSTILCFENAIGSYAEFNRRSQISQKNNDLLRSHHVLSF
jgi:hypothetical protein